MSRIRNNVRWKYIFRGEPDDGDYIPGMYERSEREPDEANESIEECLDNLEASLRRERRKYSNKYIWPNLTPMQNGFIKRFEKMRSIRSFRLIKTAGWQLSRRNI